MKESGLDTQRVRQGYGEMVWPQAKRYIGYWYNNMMDGFGYLRNSDGSFY